MNTILWAILTAICSPFLIIWTALKPRPLQRKILIIQWAKLGDMVCTTPMFRAIKQAHPEWTVHILCRKSSAVAVANNPFIDRVIAYSGTRGQLIQELSREHYDTVVNCLPGAFWSMLGLWCGAKDRINTSSKSLGRIIPWATVFNTVNMEYRVPKNTFKHYMDLLKPLGVAPIPYALDFFPSEIDQAFARQWMQKHQLHDRSFVLCNVSAGNAIKEWPAEKFAELADEITKNLHLTVVLSTLDQSRIEKIKGLSKHPDNIVDASSLSLGECGALCAHAAVFVAVDTGPLYIAYAMGAPVVALVGGSDPAQQLPPQGERSAHVLPPEGCRPWMFVTQAPRTATPEQMRCIRDIPVHAVQKALEDMLRS